MENACGERGAHECIALRRFFRLAMCTLLRTAPFGGVATFNHSLSDFRGLSFPCCTAY